MNKSKEFSYRMKLVQETIDNKNYEQFKKDALELAEKKPFEDIIINKECIYCKVGGTCNECKIKLECENYIKRCSNNE